MKEDILVVPTSVLNKLGLLDSKYTVLTPDVHSKLVSALSRREFMPRQEVETNTDYVQVIPYVTIFTGPGKLLWYKRAGTEGRLHDYYSIGFGGHVKKEENGCINCATERELFEELGIAMLQRNLVKVGLIYDNSVPVSAVHLGIHCGYMLLEQDKKTLKPSSEIAEWGECAISELGKFNIENWSRICLDNAHAWSNLFTDTYIAVQKSTQVVEQALQKLSVDI